MQPSARSRLRSFPPWLAGAALLLAVPACRVTDLPLLGPGQPSPTACPVQKIAGISYYDGPEAKEGRQKLDLFLPKGRKDFPVVLLVHGGAWIMGDNRCCGLYSSVAEFLASQGIAAA